jgi:hypothetical protein
MTRLWSGETPPAEKPPEPERRHARLYEAEYARQRRRIARIRSAIEGGEPAAPARAGRSWDEPPATAPRRARAAAAGDAPGTPPPRSAVAAVAPGAPPPHSATAAVPGAPPPRSATAAVPGAPPPRSATAVVPGAPPPRSATAVVPGAPPPRAAAAVAPGSAPPRSAAAGDAPQSPRPLAAVAGAPSSPPGTGRAPASPSARIAGWAPPDPDDTRPGGASRSRTGRRAALIAAAAVVALAVFALTRADRGLRPELLRLPAPATDLVSAGGRLWMASPQAGAVWALSDESAEPAEPAIRAAGTPARLAVSDGVAWAADTRNGALVRLSPRGSPVRVGPDVTGVALAGGAGWTASAADGGIRVLRRGRARMVGVVGHPVALATDGRSVVVAGADGAIAWLDGRTRAPVATVRTDGMPVAVAFAHGAAWVADAGGGTVRRVAPVATVVAGPPIELGARPVAIAARGRDVYVACRGVLVRIDAQRGVVTRRVPFAFEPSAIAVDDEYVWVAAAGRDLVARFDRRRLS